MTQPPLPWGTPYPPSPPTRPGELQPSRAGDVAAAWVLWVVLSLGCFLVWLLMLLIGLGVGIQCSTSSVRDAVCSGRASDVAETGYYGTWVVMFLAVVVSLVMTIVATVRRRLAWVWPVGAMGVVVLSFLIWWIAYETVT